MVVLNSRDRYENVWLLKYMCLQKQPFKNHNAKNQLQLYWYNTNNAITSFKVAKCCYLHPIANFQKLVDFVCQPACQPVNRKRPSALTARCIAFNISENIGYFHRHEPLIFRSPNLLGAIACPLFYLLHQ